MSAPTAIQLGRLVRAPGRLDGRPGSRGRIEYAESSDGRLTFHLVGRHWTVTDRATGRHLSHADTSLPRLLANRTWLLAELDRHGVVPAGGAS